MNEEDLEVSPKSSQSDEEGGVTAADQLTPTSPKPMPEEVAAATGLKSPGKALQQQQGEHLSFISGSLSRQFVEILLLKHFPSYAIVSYIGQEFEIYE